MNLRLQKVPIDSNIKILLPKWADNNLFKESEFHNILNKTKKEAHKMLVKLNNIEIIQKLISLSKLFEFDDIKSILQIQIDSGESGKYK